MKIEAILRQHPAIEYVFTTVGATGAPERISFFLKINDEYNTCVVMDEVRKPLANAPGLTFTQGLGGLGWRHHRYCRRSARAGECEL